MFLLERLISRSSRSLAALIAFATGRGLAGRGGRRAGPDDRMLRFRRLLAPRRPLPLPPRFFTPVIRHRGSAMFRPLRSLTRAAVLACAIGGVSLACAQAALKLSGIPDESPTVLQRKFAPLGKYLEEQLGRRIEWTPVNDYAAVVEALAARKIDMAWLGGVTFVQARARTGSAIPIVQREEDEKFTSKI
ncbi:MAG: PhnD/SsuA/transferrin family substrate-binding protein, partial [Burkholderiales bacterium]